jgi:hypothetical protein
MAASSKDPHPRKKQRTTPIEPKHAFSNGAETRQALRSTDPDALVKGE